MFQTPRNPTERAFIKQIIPAVPMKIVIETINEPKETLTVTRESIVGTTWTSGWHGSLERNENGKVVFYADR